MTYHTPGIRESDSNPASGLSLHEDIKKLIVACVSINADEDVTLGWCTAGRVTEYQTIIERIAHLVQCTRSEYNTLSI